MGRYNVHGGHNKIVPGAAKFLNEVTEDRKVKSALIELLDDAGHTVYDCTDDAGRTSGANLANIVVKCNRHTVDRDISIHLNSGRKDSKGDGKTGGVEVFIYDADLKKVAKAVADAIAEEFGYALRSADTTPSGCAGVKISKGLYVLRNTKAPAMLIECCFVDDKDDAKAWNAERCARAIYKGLTGKTASSGNYGASKPSGGSKPTTSTKSYKGKINTPRGVNVRSGAGKKYGILTAIPNGKTVTISKTSGDWGYTSYGGKKGWICLDYTKKVTSSSSSSSGSSKPSYKTGKTYTLQVELKVRTGAGTNYRAKKRSEFTTDGRNHDKDGDACLDKGTRITCQQVKNVGSDIWIKCPSGWIAGYYQGEVYVK